MSLPNIFFAHANGFPASSYEYFFAQLAPYEVSAPEILGMNEKYPLKHRWHDLVPELIEELEKGHQEPVIGLGHSFGAVVMFLTAQQRPELFRQVIMMDPPIFDRKMRLAISITRKLGLAKRLVPIARNALRRRDHFRSREDAKNYWLSRTFFQSFHPQCFEDYLTHGLVQSDDGVKLRIPKETEAHIFTATPGLRLSGRVEVPSHWIIPSNGVLKPFGWREQQRKFAQTQFVFWEGNHMFPLEQPLETAEKILSLIQ
jgi:pimeloyl-ACP methyl ester carboxylesterase